MTFRHKALQSFWNGYSALPFGLRQRAEKQFELLLENPSHPSLHLKPIGGLWSARVTESHRVLAIREGDVFTWFWIGSHSEYERLLKN